MFQSGSKSGFTLFFNAALEALVIEALAWPMLGARVAAGGIRLETRQLDATVKAATLTGAIRRDRPVLPIADGFQSWGSTPSAVRKLTTASARSWERVTLLSGSPELSVWPPTSTKTFPQFLRILAMISSVAWLLGPMSKLEFAKLSFVAPASLLSALRIRSRRHRQERSLARWTSRRKVPLYGVTSHLPD